MNRSIAPIVLALILGALTTADAKSEDLSNAEARQIADRLNQEWAAAFEARDADLLAKLFVSNGARLPNGLPTAIGRESLRQQYQQELDSLDDVDVKAAVTTDEVIVSGGLILARGASYTQLNSRDAADPIQAKGKWMAVLEKDEAGVWRYRWSTFNETRE